MSNERSTQLKALGELAEILSEWEDGALLPSDETIASLLEAIHPSDLADLISAAPDGIRLNLFQRIPDQEDAALVLARVDESVREDLLEALPIERKAELLQELSHDEAADVLAELPESEKDHILAEMPADEAAELRELAKHPEDSAGGLMNDEFLVARRDQSVRAVLMDVKTYEEDWEDLHQVFITDTDNKLVGVVDLDDLLRAELSQSVAEVMEQEPIFARVNEDSEEAAQRAAHYRIATLPVVDDAQQLVGVITYDDVMEALGEEASEDMYRLAGTLDQHPAREDLSQRLWARFPFLLVTVIGTYFVALVIRYFCGETSEAVEVLRFVPMIAALAGNAGIQASTTMIRGFATGEVQAKDFQTILGREMSLGVLTGFSAGAVEIIFIFAEGLVRGEHSSVLFAIPVAQAISVVMASCFGTAIPFLCWRLRFNWRGKEVRIDPALAAGPFITTLNDVASTAVALALTLGMNGRFPGT